MKKIRGTFKARLRHHKPPSPLEAVTKARFFKTFLNMAFFLFFTQLTHIFSRPRAVKSYIK